MTAWIVATALAASPVFLENLYTEQLRPVKFEKPTLITFIQPGCIPCKMQLKALECVAKKRGEEWDVWAVQSSGSSAELRRGLKPMHLGIPVFIGSPSFLAAYGADQSPTPMTAVVAKGGKVLERVLGPQPCEFWLHRPKGTR